MTKKVKIQIKNWTGEVLFEYESVNNTPKKTLEKAVSDNANLRDADLRDAYLGGAYFRGANLRGADLRGAYLGGADLRGANLGDANLGGAYLGDAYLGGADLRGAYLGDANLGDAYLRDANLGGADLRDAYLGDAYLRGADLRGADLRDANLGGADLGDANLGDANLGGAYLGDANLGDAKVDSPIYYRNNLAILKQQQGTLIAYKFLTKEMESPINDNKIKYEIGKEYSIKNSDKDEWNDCGKGLNVATLDWCLKNGEIKDNIFIEVEFNAKDIVAIPHNSDGKFRVKKFRIKRKLTQSELKKYLT